MFNRARETRDASGRFFRAETVGNQPLPRPENPAQPACKQSITHIMIVLVIFILFRGPKGAAPTAEPVDEPDGLAEDFADADTARHAG